VLGRFGTQPLDPLRPPFLRSDTFPCSWCSRSGVVRRLARAGRRATRTAHGDYLTVLSSTRTSCQTRHRRVRVASDTAPGRIIGHRPLGISYTDLKAPTRKPPLR
jgi:hypothetical protein